MKLKGIKELLEKGPFEISKRAIAQIQEGLKVGSEALNHLKRGELRSFLETLLKGLTGTSEENLNFVKMTIKNLVAGVEDIHANPQRAYEMAIFGIRGVIRGALENSSNLPKVVSASIEGALEAARSLKLDLNQLTVDSLEVVLEELTLKGPEDLSNFVQIAARTLFINHQLGGDTTGVAKEIIQRLIKVSFEKWQGIPKGIRDEIVEILRAVQKLGGDVQNLIIQSGAEIVGAAYKSGLQLSESIRLAVEMVFPFLSSLGGNFKTASERVFDEIFKIASKVAPGSSEQIKSYLETAIRSFVPDFKREQSAASREKEEETKGNQKEEVKSGSEGQNAKGTDSNSGEKGSDTGNAVDAEGEKKSQKEGKESAVSGNNPKSSSEQKLEASSEQKEKTAEDKGEEEGEISSKEKKTPENK